MDIFEQLFTEAGETEELNIDPATEALFMHGTEGIAVRVDSEDGNRLTIGQALKLHGEQLGIMREVEAMNVRLESGSRFLQHEEPLEPGLIYHVNQRIDSKGTAAAE